MTRSISDDDRLRRNQEHSCLDKASYFSLELADAILLGSTKFTQFSDGLMGFQTIVEEGLEAGC